MSGQSESEDKARNALTTTEASVTIDGTTILRQASLRLCSGEMTVIIGPNGAGKSTLLSVAAGLRRPDTGTVHLGDDDIAGLSSRVLAQRRAVMPQRTTIAFAFTVREIVAMGRTAFGSAGTDNNDITEQALDMTNLHGLASRTVTTLSGGEHQRVALARVVAQALPVAENSVILLDEPTAAMDIAHAEETLQLARELARQGAAIGLVMHDLDAAAAYADQIVLMDTGRVRAAGPVDAVCTADALSQVYRTPIEVFTRDRRVRIAPHR